MIALFLYNPTDLNAKIVGGVQICTQQYLEIIKQAANEVHFFEVGFSRSLVFRVLHKLNLDAYLSYKTNTYKNRLLALIAEKQITHVFINKAELIKFSETIKSASQQIVPKIIIMSHGNESGDFLGDLAGKKARFNGLSKYFGIFKLGLSVYLESWYRERYVDLVCTMSEEEMAIEKWLGINNPIFIPRLIDRNLHVERSPLQNVFGWVGTLNHSPNINALYDLSEKISNANIQPEIRIVGAPKAIGEQLASKYTFIKYLGPLTEDQLLRETQEWSFFLNPIFKYSRGASMKLGKAIEWEIPIITTIAGKRGYFFGKEQLITCDNTPVSMTKTITEQLDISTSEYQEHIVNIRKIKQSSPTAQEIGTQLREKINALTAS